MQAVALTQRQDLELEVEELKCSVFFESNQERQN